MWGVGFGLVWGKREIFLGVEFGIGAHERWVLVRKKVKEGFGETEIGMNLELRARVEDGSRGWWVMSLAGLCCFLGYLWTLIRLGDVNFIFFADGIYLIMIK